MVRLSSSQKASINGGSCDSLLGLMEASAVFGQWEITAAAYFAYVIDGCGK
jgi:hypothetical protein